MLIVMAGLPGAGKSTLAGDLAMALGCAVLGVDQVEAAMWRAGLSRSGPTHHAAYLAVGALAAEQLTLGRQVIVDAVNGPELARAQWRQLADRTNADLRFIVVECSDDAVYRERVEHRYRKIEGLPEPTWEGIVQRRASFPPWVDEHLTVDSVNPREANLRSALEYVRES
jgi:predicted kinase